MNIFLVHFPEQPIVLVRQKRIVELNQKTGINNGPVFLPERIRQRSGDGVFVRIVTVDPKSARTHRCRDREESFGDFDAGERGLEVLNILRDGNLSAVADWTGAVPEHLTPTNGRWPLLPELRFSALRGQPVIILDGVVGGVELRELLHFSDQIDGVEFLLAGSHVAMNKSTEALGNITNPSGFAVLAVADHIDAGLGLLTHDACDFLA